MVPRDGRTCSITLPRKLWKLKERSAIYNIGGGDPVNLLEFVKTLEEELIRAGVLPADYDFAAHTELVPMQPGDVKVTYADCSGLERDYGFRPGIGIREGLRKFAEWYASVGRTI